MTTILRVKRRSTEPPLDSLMLSFRCKRQKLDLADDLNVEVLSTETVAQFAGTLNNSNDDILKHLSKILPNSDVKRGIKRAADTDLSSLERSKIAKQEFPNDKYKIISYQSLTTVEEENSQQTTLVEIENCLNIGTVYQDVESEQDMQEYVYDLYCAQTNLSLEKNELLVKELVFPDPYESEKELMHEEDDVNSESNPANEYPDSDFEVEINNDDFAQISDESTDEFCDEDESDHENNAYCYYRKIAKHYHSDTSDTSDDETDEYKSDEDDEYLDL